MLLRIAGFSLLLINSAAWASGACTSANVTGDVCLIQISALHPAQFTVGMREVEERAAAFKAMSSKKLQKYLDANPAVIVSGPEGKFYCTDHNHLALALQSIGVTTMPAQVQDNISNLSDAAFWQTMLSNNWLYLYDEASGPLPYSQLPTNVSGLQDDPYRSLAWSVRQGGGYLKTNALFADFQWANFFRTRVDVGTTDQEYQAAVTAAMVIAKSAAASALPGWSG